MKILSLEFCITSIEQTIAQKDSGGDLFNTVFPKSGEEGQVLREILQT